MKKLRLTLISMVTGLVLTIPLITALAQCAQTIVVDGKTCVLVGQNCGGGVCVCAYNCGPATEQGDQ